jgi:hypothetical protein
MRRVLILAERWIDGDPSRGPSNAEHNLVGSLEATGLAEVQTFHLDEHGPSPDAAILSLAEATQPDLVVLSWMPNATCNPSHATLQALEAPIVAVWWDAVFPPIMAMAEALLDVVDLNVVVDSAAPIAASRQQEKYLALWAPQDPRVYHDPGIPRDVGISLPGQLYPERTAGINTLRRAGIDVLHTGGQRTDTRVSLAEYASVYQRSKITLNFARSREAYQVKGRVFEATLCGSMLLEAANPETARLLTPMVDYVPFDSRQDLVEKARYYLAHDDERRAIAEHGQRTVATRYSNEVWWRTVFDRTLEAAA